MKIVVFGIVGLMPFAGVAWQVLHYLEGLRRLGWDPLYAEDTGAWPYDPDENAITSDARYATRHIDRAMSRSSPPYRWAYVAPDGEVLGIEASAYAAELRAADALLNVTGATLLREQHMRVPVRIYLETDPVRPQIEIAQGNKFTIELLAAHTHHFSYGELLGTPACRVPVERFDFAPTRQPVVLDWWPLGRRGGAYTTVGSWHQSHKDIEWQGKTYFWSKDREFVKLASLPRLAAPEFELALAYDEGDDIELMRSNGWRIADGFVLSRDLAAYRAYILGSSAELTVAKDQNVRLVSGWFSDRSACYLAAGKPVVTQDTGFPAVLPTGRGLFAFRTVEEALAAVEAIEADYPSHSEAAHEIAAEHFDAVKVLGSLLARAGL